MKGTFYNERKARFTEKIQKLIAAAEQVEKEEFRGKVIGYSVYTKGAIVSAIIDDRNRVQIGFKPKHLHYTPERFSYSVSECHFNGFSCKSVFNKKQA